MLPGNGSANSDPAGLGTAWRDAVASAIPAAMNDDMRPETRDNGDTPSPSAGASAGTSPGTSTAWLTYAQLAESRGISVRSAQRLVLRHRWRRQPGNDGTARVGVPAGAEKPPERHDGASDRPDARDDAGSVTLAIEALRGELTASHQREAEAHTRADRAEQRADRADAERRATETRAHDAEQGRDLANALADELRDRLDSVRADLDAAQQQAREAQVAAESAQIAQAVSEADAAELRQADAERRGRGRLARLRAAWRGE